jgi:ComF family protein
MAGAKVFLSSFSSWIYPARCALCSLLDEDAICATCMQDFVAADHVRPAIDDGPLRLVATLYPYRGRIGQAVRRLKYSRATSLAKPLSALIGEGLDRLGLQGYDIVVPIPIHWSRRCSRGFNQSELLSEALLNVDRTVLKRIRRTKPQTRLSREARMDNLAGAFRASTAVEGKSILLIDDVITSGETARECARALAAAGATKIAALALAGESF